MWEFSRHKWSDLQAMVNAAVVPHAIESLLKSGSEEAARAAAEFIDNNVVVQGTLFEAAPPTAACLVLALPSCAPAVRLAILDLLNHLCVGNFSALEESAGQSLHRKTLEEVRKGVAIYLSLLESGSAEECRDSIDLLCMCADSDPCLAEQVVWYLARVKERRLDAVLDKLIDNTAKYLMARSPAGGL